jgi:hypothetical protein
MYIHTHSYKHNIRYAQYSYTHSTNTYTRYALSTQANTHTICIILHTFIHTLLHTHAYALFNHIQTHTMICNILPHIHKHITTRDMHDLAINIYKLHTHNDICTFNQSQMTHTRICTFNHIHKHTHTLFTLSTTHIHVYVHSHTSTKHTRYVISNHKHKHITTRIWKIYILSIKYYINDICISTYTFTNTYVHLPLLFINTCISSISHLLLNTCNDSRFTHTFTNTG